MTTLISVTPISAWPTQNSSNFFTNMCPHIKFEVGIFTEITVLVSQIHHIIWPLWPLRPWNLAHKIQTKIHVCLVHHKLPMYNPKIFPRNVARRLDTCDLLTSEDLGSQITLIKLQWGCRTFPNCMPTAFLIVQMSSLGKFHTYTQDLTDGQTDGWMDREMMNTEIHRFY